MIKIRRRNICNLFNQTYVKENLLLMCVSVSRCINVKIVCFEGQKDAYIYEKAYYRK